MWETALVSAGVALVVTLLLEYAAKPRLDARKERILDGHRAAQDAVETIGRLSFVLGRFEMWEHFGETVSEGRLPEIGETARVETERLTAILAKRNLPFSEIEFRALDLVAQYADFWTAAVRHAATPGYLDFVRTDLGDATDVAEDVFALRWWQNAKRREVAAKLANLLGEPRHADREDEA
jgi:hypothetical protein